MIPKVTLFLILSSLLPNHILLVGLFYLLFLYFSTLLLKLSVTQNSYIVNRDSSRIREKHIKDFIVSLSMVDFYFEYLYLNKIISFKKYKDLVGYVVTIRKLAYGVLKNEKELC